MLSLKQLFSQCSIMLFMPFLTCFCLKVLIQAGHLLKLGFKNQKSRSWMKKKNWGWGWQVVYVSNSTLNNWCFSTIGNGRRWVFPILWGNNSNIHSYQTLIMFLLLPLFLDEADNYRNLHLSPLFCQKSLKHQYLILKCMCLQVAKKKTWNVIQCRQGKQKYNSFQEWAVSLLLSACCPWPQQHARKLYFWIFFQVFFNLTAFSPAT